MGRTCYGLHEDIYELHEDRSKLPGDNFEHPEGDFIHILEKSLIQVAYESGLRA